jgi:hypothetical protein
MKAPYKRATAYLNDAESVSLRAVADARRANHISLTHTGAKAASDKGALRATLLKAVPFCGQLAGGKQALEIN